MICSGTLLLDLDGTLVSFNPPRHDLETLRNRLLQLADVNHVPYGHRGIFRVYASLYGTLGARHPVVAQARAVIDEYEIAWATTTALPLLDGAGRAALDRFPGSWSLVTNNGMASVYALVSRGLLPDTFSCAVTRDADLPLKPSPALLARALEMVTSTGEAWFIGDSDADEAAAANFVTSSGPLLRFVRVADTEINAVLRERCG
jgi:phosphoglycolate phosphatase-like HAD superfamily hydrolase